MLRFNEKVYANTLIIISALTVLQLAAQLSLLLKGTDYIVATLTIDDSYYYFQTAWNTTQFGFPTFDGLHATNGVQLLWFWVLVLIALFSPTKIIFLYLALAAGFLLNALSYLAIWKLGVTLKRPTLSLLMVSLWALLSLGSLAYSRGLENSLHALVFWMVIWQSAAFLIQLYQGKRPSYLGLTIVLILNVWARLDAAVFSVILYSYCVFAAFKQGSLQITQRRDATRVIGSSLLAVGGMLVQLLAFRWMGGSFLPVSALVKSSGSIWEPQIIETIIGLGMPASLPVALGLVLLLTFIVIDRYTRSDWTIEVNWAWRGLWYVLLVSSVIHLIILAPGGVPYWYRSPEYIFWIVTLATIADRLYQIVTQKGFRSLARLSLVGACSLAILAGGIIFGRRLSLYYSDLYASRYKVAVWMSEQLPNDIVCASWNAGQLGFFSERTVINLDGLINSADYYHRVLNGPISLETYLGENGVNCIVDYTIERVPEIYPVLHEFPTDSRPIRIWEVVSATAARSKLDESLYSNPRSVLTDE